MLAAAARPQANNIGDLSAMKNCGERALKRTMNANRLAFVACFEKKAKARASRVYASQNARLHQSQRFIKHL